MNTHTNSCRISKNKIKFIHSFEQKKQRTAERLFIAEGHKSVGDLLREGFRPRLIVATQEWESPTTLDSSCEYIIVTPEELAKASLLLHPQQVLGLFEMNSPEEAPPYETLANELCICLDGVQDPGNLGTIIRTADWFGIKNIICSKTTADAYNPKVVQATMGSISRVHLCYTDLYQYIKGIPSNIPVYGTVLDGDDIYKTELQNNGLIIMGNEGNGISDSIKGLLTQKLLIPAYKTNSTTAESLNVSIATAIICSEFRRRC